MIKLHNFLPDLSALGRYGKLTTVMFSNKQEKNCIYSEINYTQMGNIYFLGCIYKVNVIYIDKPHF